MVRRRIVGQRQGGFTYLAVILMVAMIGAGLGATGQVWRTVVQREKEKELLFIGRQFQQAIRSYVEGSPGGSRRFPRSLEELVSDSRFPGARRYLRRIYRDPMTQSFDWGLVRAPDGGIAGVYTRSEARPLKIAGFAARDARLEKANSYSEWLFTYEARTAVAAPPPRGVPPGGPGGEPATLFPME